MGVRSIAFAALAGVGAVSVAHAGMTQLRITVENIAPTNSIAFAPTQFGFHDGTFDVFNAGATATAPIISVAETADGVDWFPAFAAQQPNGNSGTVHPSGPLGPGASGFVDIAVDSSLNRYFTFAAMALPSNDYFVGNDSPTQFEVFDAQGNFIPTVITQTAGDIWEAGSEVDGVFGAAFLPGSDMYQRIAEDGVIAQDFAGMSIFDGLTTAAGYTFDNQLTTGLEVYRITIRQIPAPGAMASLGLAGLAFIRRRGR